MSVLKRIRAARPLQVLGWLSVPVFPLFCLFVMDYMNYRHMDDLRVFWQDFPGSVKFECLVVLFLFAVALLLLRRAWAAGALFGALSLVCAYVNYMKVALNGDNFYPQDLAMAGQAGELASFISGDLPKWFWLGLCVIVAWVAGLWVLGLKLPGSFFARWSAAALLAVCACMATASVERTGQLLSRFGMSSFDNALQRSNYTANGFVGAFTLNVFSMRAVVPDGYDRQTVEALLSGYDSVPAQEGAEQFDVVVVLSESFFDPRILPGVSFSENPLTNYDRLLDSERTWSGQIYTTAVGGGTVRPEFGILTGLTTDYMTDVTTPYSYVTKDVTTYVSNYKDAGYTALAVHPYNKKFYSRNTAYPYLGFDAFYGEEDMADLVGDVTYKRGYVTDTDTARAMTKLVDSQDQPTFLFAITMQNHQPFNALEPKNIHIQVNAPALSEPSYTALTTYTQGLYDADQMLGMLCDWIDSRERPTALVFFGDHLPTLGPNHLAYNETGFINSADGLDPEELQRLYSTPFLIYSNRDLAPGLLSGHTGNGISDYNLLNSLARSAGMARTPYMELLADFHAAAPFYNVRLGMEVTDELKSFTRAMELITYDRVQGRGWSN